jgi:hypothetical protein
MRKLKYQVILIVLIVFGSFFVGVMVHETYHLAYGVPNNPSDLCITFGGDDYSGEIFDSIAYTKHVVYKDIGGGSEIVAYLFTLIVTLSLILIGFKSIGVISKNHNLKRDRRKR